jgi:hypothetical protein
MNKKTYLCTRKYARTMGAMEEQVQSKQKN